MNIKELLKKLVDSEDYVAQLYKKIAKTSEDEFAETVLLFAKQEGTHAIRIGSLLNQLENPDAVVPMEIALLPQWSLTNESVHAESTNFTTRKKLFLYALQVEKDSIVLYEEIVRLFNEDTEGKRIFVQLIEEERKHMYFILRRLHELK